jgi:2-oxoglutarate ferredoxin oxidoreductase subunit beta
MHGVAQRLIAELLDEMSLRERAVGIMPVGCATLAYTYLNFDTIHAAHGRAPAVATGYKRSRPDSFVFTYQGDGDLAAIGLAEIIHAANRGEKFSAVFINNSIYGMTGGQMAPTTLVGQKSTTAQGGRQVEMSGYPIRMCELLSTLKAPVYVARFALNTPANILKAKKGIKKAFTLQLENKGFAFVELLSNCPTNWGLSPEESLNWISENMIPYYPLGEYKTPEGSESRGN